MTMKTNGPSTSIPDMTDEDWQAFAAACSPRPAPSAHARESSASKPKTFPSTDERRAEEALGSAIDTSRELEEFCTTSPIRSADEIVARQLAKAAPGPPGPAGPLQHLARPAASGALGDAPKTAQHLPPVRAEVADLRREVADLTRMVREIHAYILAGGR